MKVLRVDARSIQRGGEPEVELAERALQAELEANIVAIGRNA